MLLFRETHCQVANKCFSALPLSIGPTTSTSEGCWNFVYAFGFLKRQSKHLLLLPSLPQYFGYILTTNHHQITLHHPRKKGKLQGVGSVNYLHFLGSEMPSIASQKHQLFCLEMTGIQVTRGGTCQWHTSRSGGGPVNATSRQQLFICDLATANVGSQFTLNPSWCPGAFLLRSKGL